MEERVAISPGNDVLGEFFEQHISNGRNGQYFTPFHICQFMASISHTDRECDSDTVSKEPLRILYPTCGSGRMLLASHRLNALDMNIMVLILTVPV
jgi:type I restriction-modification system DNA methylase subunit